jgi:hypothetical protein
MFAIIHDRRVGRHPDSCRLTLSAAPERPSAG